MNFSMHYPSAKSNVTIGNSSGLSETRIIVTRRSWTLYQTLFVLGSGGTSWSKETLSARSPQTAEILNAFGPFGFLQIPDSIQVIQFQDLGQHAIHGQQTTAYHFGTSTCRSGSDGTTQHYSSSPTTLWVDDRGRLSQGESNQTVVFRNPLKSPDFNGRSTESVTVRLFDFGVPVKVTAPSSAAGAMSIFFANSKCTG